MILAHLATIVGILISLVPLIFTAAKIVPKIIAFFRAIFGASKGYVGKSGAAGVALAIFTFIGGVGFVVFMYYNFSLEFYLGWLDFVLTPFAFVIKGLLNMIISQLPASMPQSFAAILGIFDFAKIVSLFLVGWCTEFYMRMFIYFFARRK